MKRALYVSQIPETTSPFLKLYKNRKKSKPRSKKDFFGFIYKRFSKNYINCNKDEYPLKVNPTGFTD